MNSFAKHERPRVLLVSLAGIGNLLMASPLFRALKDVNPTTEIDVLVAPRGTPDLLSANPRIRRVLLGSAKPSLKQWIANVYHLQRGRYDAGLIAVPGQLVTSASLLAFGTVRKRIGHRYSWKFLHNTRRFLTDPIELLDHTARPLSDRGAHDVMQNVNLLWPFGIHRNAAEVQLDFPLTPDDRTHADQWRASHDLGAVTLIGFHPGGHGDLAYKRWPVERWVALGDYLAEYFGATILVFGGPKEQTLATEICARMWAPAVPVDLPLRAAAALMAQCLAFVSNDSGLMHVAASQHVPTFGLFGPTDERRTAPWGPRCFVIRALGTHPSYDVRHLKRVRTVREPDPSLQALQVETVVREIQQRLVVRHDTVAGGVALDREVQD